MSAKRTRPAIPPEKSAEILRRVEGEHLTIGQVCYQYKIGYVDAYVIITGHYGRNLDEHSLRLRHHQLNWVAVTAIRREAAEGKDLRQLAREYTVTLQTIRDVIAYRSWRDDDR